MAKKCINCMNKIPSFNIQGQLEALYCKNCKQEGMVNVKKCKEKGCRKSVYWIQSPNFLSGYCCQHIKWT